MDSALNDPMWQSYGTTPGDMPRYRHHMSTDALFADGHVKAIHRGQMDWYKNVYIPRRVRGSGRRGQLGGLE